MASKRAIKSKSERRTVTQPPTVIPAVYLRVSTEEQAKDGFGLDVQERRCLAQAIAKGWSEVRPEHIYRDEGISGTKDASGRPGLAAMLEAVKCGEVTAVIVMALDRLGRSTMITLDLVMQITEVGAELVSCRESLDTTTPTGRFVLTMFAALAELDHRNLVEKLGWGRDARGQKDGEKGGPLPFGYKRVRDDDGKTTGVKVDRALAPIVRRIDRDDRRGVSQRRIAAALTDAGVPGPRGGKWYASSVGEILRNRSAYKGGKRGDSDARWPAIL